MVQIVCVALLFTSPLRAQSNFLAASSLYDDSPREWLILTENDSFELHESSLRLKWPFRNDPSEWLVEHYLDYFAIRQLNNRYPILWEIRGPNEVITVRQKWRNDANIWVIQYRDMNITWQTLHTNNFEAWFFEISEENFFELWTRYEFDVRDWDINDQTKNIPDIVKIAALFTSLSLHLPR